MYISLILHQCFIYFKKQKTIWLYKKNSCIPRVQAEKMGVLKNVVGSY